MNRKTSPAILSRILHLVRTETAVLGGLLVVALGVWVFAGLADETGEAGGQAFDRAVLMAMRPNPDPSDAWGPAWLQVAAGDITALGGIAVLGLFAMIAIGFLLIQKKRLSALLLVLGLAGGVALSEVLKGVFERVRPPEAFQAVETVNASFPSGHALLSTVFYLTVGVMLARTLPRRRLKTFVLAAAVLIAVLVGLTRVYLAAHWATDVLAGWSVGATWAMCLWLVADMVGRWSVSGETGQNTGSAPPADPK
ncbi:phosphatase PAP2 family protein [uncultured Brevundimonas sp.]|uniref:phosphatase PAP2 family protein n=1 Tax=uncultured Brevundimonas sp. TaxID=213418 RepID=UPI0030EE2414|tara:strand:+ start:10323 stop:11081 length:759 start_codon:yes stop_codon:yes gene_type:complete